VTPSLLTEILLPLALVMFGMGLSLTKQYFLPLLAVTAGVYGIAMYIGPLLTIWLKYFQQKSEEDGS